MWESQYTSDYLAHHGILGMRWGVRRYQNEDGSLTAEGRLRYKQNDNGTYRKTTKEERAKEQDLQDRQAEWDKNVSEHWYEAWNSAVDKYDEISEQIGRKFEQQYNKRVDDWTDEEYAKYESFVDDVMTMIFDEELGRLFGDRPE